MLMKNGFIALMIVAGMTACGEKKAPESAAESEAKRELMRSFNEAATNLAKLGRHDKQYYMDRFAEALSGCIKGGDVDMSCFKSRLSKIESE
jgi:hypothetical protein